MESEKMLSGDLKLEAGREKFEINLTIPANPVKPQRILPVLQKFTNQVVERGIQRSNEAGKPISCKAACGACCRQPLLISEAEVYNLSDVIESMPPERKQTIEQRFRQGHDHFERIDWFNRFDEMSEIARTTGSEESKQQFIDLISEYMEQQIACPFLEAESCSIYEDRPLICREYLVTSPAENCVSPKPETIAKMPISVKPSKAFSMLAKTEDSKDPSSLLLIRLIEFAEAHTEKFEEKSGPAWMEGFFNLITNRPEPASTEKAAEAPG